MNGLPAGSVSGGPTYFPQPTYFFVGGHGAYETDFAGAIADVRLFNNYALSVPEVAIIYAAGLTTYPPTPPGILRVITSQ